MEKKLFYHPIIVRDNVNGIAFSCTILNDDEKKIDTLDALKAAMLTFGENYGSLNVSGSYQGKQLLTYYFKKNDGNVEFKFRFFDPAVNKLVEVVEDKFVPDYMFDAVNRIY